MREALEHQTATAEVLGIISRSPTDVQPVSTPSSRAPPGFVGSMTWCCDSATGTRWFRGLILVRYPLARVEVQYLMSHSIAGCASMARSMFRTVRAQNDFPTLGPSATSHLLSRSPSSAGDFIGALSARRIEVRPFTPAQIKLLETFADQAVIAIENVRLFNELKESLEQQTATNEILGVIASSPTDIQPVLNAVTENAARLCDATDAQIRLVDGNMLQHVAAYGPMRATPSRVISRGFTGGRAIVDRRTIHIHDLEAVREVEYPETPIHGYRTVLAVPLLRKDTPIGVINIRRLEVRPFSDKQIKLLETFAAQAVIAIENVRLFKEFKSAMELREARSIRRQRPKCSASSAARPRTFSRSSTPIVESAARVCGIDAQIVRKPW